MIGSWLGVSVCRSCEVCLRCVINPYRPPRQLTWIISNPSFPSSFIPWAGREMFTTQSLLLTLHSSPLLILTSHYRSSARCVHHLKAASHPARCWCQAGHIPSQPPARILWTFSFSLGPPSTISLGKCATGGRWPVHSHTGLLAGEGGDGQLIGTWFRLLFHSTTVAAAAAVKLFVQFPPDLPDS